MVAIGAALTNRPWELPLELAGDAHRRAGTAIPVPDSPTVHATAMTDVPPRPPTGRRAPARQGGRHARPPRQSGRSWRAPTHGRARAGTARRATGGHRVIEPASPPGSACGWPRPEPRRSPSIPSHAASASCARRRPPPGSRSSVTKVTSPRRRSSPRAAPSAAVSVHTLDGRRLDRILRQVHRLLRPGAVRAGARPPVRDGRHRPTGAARYGDGRRTIGELLAALDRNNFRIETIREPASTSARSCHRRSSSSSASSARNRVPARSRRTVPRPGGPRPDRERRRGQPVSRAGDGVERRTDQLEHATVAGTDELHVDVQRVGVVGRRHDQT